LGKNIVKRHLAAIKIAAKNAKDREEKKLGVPWCLGALVAIFKTVKLMICRRL